MRYLFKSNNLIGDALYISGPLRSWLKQNYVDGIDGDEVYLQTLNDHITHLYPGMVRDLPVQLKIVFEDPNSHFDFKHTFDVNKAFQLSDQKKCHISESYAEMLGVELEGSGNAKYKPTFFPDFNDPDIKEHMDEIQELQECILISMYSMSCASRGNPPGPPNKMLPWEKWIGMLRVLRDSFPLAQIRTLGAPSDKPPGEFRMLDSCGITPMHGIPLNRLAIIMQFARLLVTIDNGMSHLAATQGLPTFLMYPRALMPHYILPKGNPNLDWIHMDPNRVNGKQLEQALTYKIRKLKNL